jgi:hypothetical protein
MNRQQRRALERQGIEIPPQVMEAPKGKVWYAVIHGDFTDNSFAWSLKTLEDYDRSREHHLGGYGHMYSGPLLSHARNQMVEEFLKSDAKWMWCLDDDMVFRPDLLEQLMSVADDTKPIVSGLYFGGGKSAIIAPHVFVVGKNEEGYLVTERRADYPKDRPFEADGVGAGCLLIHRRVLEVMGDTMRPITAYPFFAETELQIGEAERMGVGEDITFCLRARKCGFPIWVDPRPWLGHSKRYTIDRDVYEAQLTALALVGETEVGRNHLEKLGVVVT